MISSQSVFESITRIHEYRETLTELKTLRESLQESSFETVSISIAYTNFRATPVLASLFCRSLITLYEAWLEEESAKLRALGITP